MFACKQKPAKKQTHAVLVENQMFFIVFTKEARERSSPSRLLTENTCSAAYKKSKGVASSKRCRADLSIKTINSFH